MDNPQESVGGAEDHVVAVAVPDNLLDVAGDALIFLLGAPGVLAGHVPRNQQRPPGRMEHGLGIDLIVLRIPAQQFLIILYRQQRGGKKNRAAALLHALLQILFGVHAHKLQQEAAVLRQLRVLHIILVQQIIHVKKMPHLKIEVQQQLPHRQLLFLLF